MGNPEPSGGQLWRYVRSYLTVYLGPVPLSPIPAREVHGGGPELRGQQGRDLHLS